MEKLRDVLVTDRSPADVAARNEKGTYNAEDLNRVLRACSWLAGRLEGYGYAVPGEYFPAVLVHTQADPPDGGTVHGTICYKGETAVVAAAATGWHEFSHWEENGEIVSEDKQYSFIADRDRELTAVFSTNGEDYGVIGIGRIGMAIVGRKGA